MQLDEFVKATIMQVVKGVKDAQEEAAEYGAVVREFNFEVRHSPMPPDGTLRIP